MRKSVTPEEPVAKPRMYRQRSAIPLQRNNHYAKRQPHPQQQQLQQQQQQQQLQLQLQLQQQQHEQQSLTPSPLFNIRYKSMTNLLAADSGNSIKLSLIPFSSISFTQFQYFKYFHKFEYFYLLFILSLFIFFR